LWFAFGARNHQHGAARKSMGGFVRAFERPYSDFQNRDSWTSSARQELAIVKRRGADYLTVAVV